MMCAFLSKALSEVFGSVERAYVPSPLSEPFLRAKHAFASYNKHSALSRSSSALELSHAGERGGARCDEGQATPPTHTCMARILSAHSSPGGSVLTGMSEGS